MYANARLCIQYTLLTVITKPYTVKELSRIPEPFIIPLEAVRPMQHSLDLRPQSSHNKREKEMNNWTSNLVRI